MEKPERIYQFWTENLQEPSITFCTREENDLTLCYVYRLFKNENVKKNI